VVWRKIEVSQEVFAGLMPALLEACERDRMAAHASGIRDPKIALFCSPVLARTKAFYFSPACGSWADEVVRQHSGGPCTVPGFGTVDLLIGDARDMGLLDSTSERGA
jgi:hypothetical protein